MQGAEQQGDKGILGMVGAILASRSVINTANRFIYPFAPVISRGLPVICLALVIHYIKDDFSKDTGIRHDRGPVHRLKALPTDRQGLAGWRGPVQGGLYGRPWAWKPCAPYRPF